MENTISSQDYSWIQQLKPGDRVIVRHPYNPSEVKTVKSIGKRLITLEDHYCRFSVCDGWQVGKDFTRSHIKEATLGAISQIEKEIAKQELIQRIEKKINLEKLSFEQLTKIAEIIGISGNG